MRPEGLPCRTLRSTRWRGRAIRSGERLPAPPPRRPLLPCSVATLALLLPAVAQAQQAPTGNPSAWSILEQDLLILFRILVVATVIERLLEYLGLAWEVIAKGLERLLQNRPWLRRISPGPLPTDLAKIRKQLILQSIGMLLGVTLCWRAHLGIFAQL
ncbi:MAG: hypothetical protein ONB23_07190, partial [candidate division KSB1 bacterium]|nr:hypothetical protein [candidate division KSB1 bacterium]